MKKILYLVFCLLLFVGCTDAGKSQLKAYGSTFTIVQFSGGKEIGRWVSTGKVATESNSDGYYFTDSRTGKLTRVAGTVQILEN